MTTRLCLLGHSGVGKSTTATLIKDMAATRDRRCAVVKVAAPLYELQHHFYARMGMVVPPGQQDQELLESLARWMRTREPEFLVSDFLARAAREQADVLVNDDVRSYDHDLPELRRRGWITVRIWAPEPIRAKRLAAQGYLSLSDTSTAGVDVLAVDHDIVNDTTLAALRAKVEQLLEVLPC